VRAFLLIVVLLLGWLTVSPRASAVAEEVRGEHEAERVAVLLDRERASGSLPGPKKRFGEPSAFVVLPSEPAIFHRRSPVLLLGPTAGRGGTPELRRIRCAGSPRGPPGSSARSIG
jgi:hypothetical protein